MKMGHQFLSLLAFSLLLLTSRCEESLDAYIPATHKTLYESYNVVVFGDASLARAAVRGPLAVQGRADLADFDIAGTGMCNKNGRAIVVGGTLTARMGAVHNGYTVVGQRSNIHHSVRRTCTARTEQYDPQRNGDIEFDVMRTGVLRETGDICVTEPGGTVETVNETLRFTAGEKGYSCYTHFKTNTDQLRLVKKWELTGNDTERNIVIAVTGSKVDFRDFQMQGFNAKRTLIVFCAVYGTYGFYSAKLHASILAPTSSFTTMNAIFNGSLITGNLRGSLATLNTPYVTC